MRVIPTTIFNQLTQSLDKTIQDYAAENAQLASGKKIQAPSDNVGGTLRALDYKLEISGNDQYQQNISIATTNLNIITTTLTSLSSTLADAKHLIPMASAGNMDPLTAAGLSNQAAQLRDEMLSLGNTSSMGQYVFAGFQTTTTPYSALSIPAYEYQGDAGVSTLPVGQGASVQTNVTGNDAFAYTLAAPYTKQLSGGRTVNYTSLGGTIVQAQILNADATVYRTFTFSNVIQMTDLLSTAIGANDKSTMEALVDPYESIQTQVNSIQAEVGARLRGLGDQQTLLLKSSTNLKNTISLIEDADAVETAANLRKTEVALEALREAASRVMSQSLFDFLK
jgi:flagellar hook-associated protein 3 FlgL